MSKTTILCLALAACLAAPAMAQITANSGPGVEGLPAAALFTAAAPVFPVPTQWSATVSYAVTNPTPGLYTYWYKVDHLGGAVAPIQSLKSSTLNLDPSFVQDIGGVLQFGQLDLGPGQSWAAEALYPGDSTIRWSIGGAQGMNALTTGNTIYLWMRSTYAPGKMINLTLQDGTVGQTRVLGPTPVPEPMSMALVGIGLSAIAGLRRKSS